MGKYLLTWAQLRQFYKLQEKWRESKKTLIDREKLEKLDTAEVKSLIKELGKELQRLPQKSEKKKDQYKDFTEYLKYDKIDFLPIEKILNKNVDATKTTFILAISFLLEIVVLRSLPTEEVRNYKRLLMIFFISVLFFVIYTVEYWRN